jgi:hypothetical protein
MTDFGFEDDDFGVVVNQVCLFEGFDGFEEVTDGHSFVEFFIAHVLSHSPATGIVSVVPAMVIGLSKH